MTLSTSPATITERNLHEIADSIWESVEQGKQSAMQALDANLAIGRDLMDARTRFPSDNDFGEWFAGQSFPFSRQWAWTLRSASENESAVRQRVASQLATGAAANIEKAVRDVRRPRLAAVPSEPLAQPETGISNDVQALAAFVEELDDLRASLAISQIVPALQVRSRAAFARRLRQVGTYLGAIALALEDEA